MFIKSHFLFGIAARKKRDRQTNKHNIKIYCIDSKKDLAPLCAYLDSYFSIQITFFKVPILSFDLFDIIYFFQVITY